MRLQSYQGLQLGILLAVLEDRRFAEQPVQPPENLKVFFEFSLCFLFICLRAFSPGQLAGECSSRGWADQRRSGETECPGLVEGWRQAETEKVDLN